MSPLSVTLTDGDLRALGAVVPGPKSAISPLGTAPTGALDIARLVQLGVLTATGAPSPAAYPALQVLANARAFAGIVSADNAISEHVSYFDGASAVSLTALADGIHLDDPASTPAIVGGLSGDLGFGDLVPVALDVTFATADAVTLLAAIDLRRRQILSALAADSPTAAQPFTAAAIAQQARPSDRPQWLAQLAASTLGVPPLDASAAAASLQALAARGLLIADAGGFLPSAALDVLCERFLALHMLVRINAGRLTDDGRVATTDIRIAQSNYRDLLLWEMSGGQVHLQTLSPDQLVLIATKLLTDGEALTDFARSLRPVAPQPPPAPASVPPPAASAPPEPATAPAAATGPRFCPQCGTPTTPGARFCRSCGRRLVA